MDIPYPVINFFQKCGEYTMFTAISATVAVICVCGTVIVLARMFRNCEEATISIPKLLNFTVKNPKQSRTAATKATKGGEPNAEPAKA
jgi:CobQ-like glutamine amidotransferase family enzyme